MEINVQAQDPDSVPPIHLPPNLRIAFIHPDLGLGASLPLRRVLQVNAYSSCQPG